MKRLSVLLLFVIIIWFLVFRDDSVTLGPGVTAPDVPLQEKIDSPVSFPFKDYTITPLAKFSIRAKVLSREEYSFGREAELSPLDLALGWGTMSDEDVLDSIEIWQTGRWYRWQAKTFPIPRKDIETQSANMHMVPADSYIEDLMDDARKGDLVEFSGSLVKIEADDGWRWISSQTRNDTGARACEVVWVDDFRVIEY
ncbi:MAG: hypothetical protein ABW140_05710 [Candidatus Sedimenticola sp. 6PFRAG1]